MTRFEYGGHLADIGLKGAIDARVSAACCVLPNAYHADQHAKKTPHYHCTDCHAILCYAVLCYALLCSPSNATLRYATLCCAIVCCTVLCCAMLCNPVPYNVMPCSNVLWYAGDHCMLALWACMLPELSVDAGGHDTVDMEGAHRVADVSGMQHCLHQQHPIFLLLHHERACSAHG